MAVLRFQCNYDGDYDTDSLSTVLRAYLIEDLIRQGLKELVIWGGTGPPLSRYVSYPPHDWRTPGCTDSRVACSTVFYVEVRASPSQAVGLRRAMDLLIGDKASLREPFWRLGFLARPGLAGSRWRRCFRRRG
jgi:hypothetical protein